MNLFQVVVTAVLTTITVLVLGVVAVWSAWPTTAEASAAVAAHSVSWHNGNGDHCQRFGPAHVDLGAAVITAALDLTDDQQAALDPIAQTVEHWRGRVQAACQGMDHGSLGMTGSLEPSLDALHAVLSDSADAVAALKPQLAAFHDSLDDAQLQRLHEFVASHRGMHGRRGHGFGH